MESFNDILNEMIQKNEDFPKTVEAFAKKINISDAQLSRIRSNKSPLSDNVISKIFEYFAKNNKDYADNLKNRLEKVQLESAQFKTKKNKTNIKAIDEYAELLEKMSQESSLLIVEYRDFPISLVRFPHILKLSLKAIQKGLCVALFQPFGSREALYEKHNFLGNKSSKITEPSEYKNADIIVNSYDYLIRLAGEVSNLYRTLKNQLSEETKGQIVLYEAEYMEYTDKGKVSSALPSIVASGINSKLYYASFPDSSGYQTKIYEWISGKNDDFFFVERSNTTLNFNAVKMQFHPISAYWDQEKKLPETEGEINDANKAFGIKKLFGIEESVKWNIFSL